MNWLLRRSSSLELSAAIHAGVNYNVGTRSFATGYGMAGVKSSDGQIEPFRRRPAGRAPADADRRQFLGISVAGVSGAD